MQPSKELAPPMHRCRQQHAPVVRRDNQPPQRSKAPAPAPSRCHRQLLGQNPGRRLVTSPPLSSSSRRRSRACIGRPTGPSHAAGKSVPRRCSRTDSPGYAGKVCRADAVEQARWDKGAAGQPPGVRRAQQAAAHRARAANAPPPPAARAFRATGQAAAAAALQGSGSGSGSEPMPPPPAAGPNPGRHLIRSSPPSSNSRRRSRACADRPAGPSCAAGKHTAPMQSKWLAGTRVRLADRPAFVGSSRQPSIELAPPMHHHRQQQCQSYDEARSRRRRAPRIRLRLRLRADAAAAGCWPKPRPASCQVVATFEQQPASKPRLADPAGPSCAAGKHATPAQSKRLARTRGPPANRPELCRVNMQPSNEPVAAEGPRRAYLGASRRADQQLHVLPSRRPRYIGG